MKRILFSLALSLGIFIAVPLSASAAPASTFINGTVTINGHAAQGAKVTVICENPTTHHDYVQTAITNSTTGDYAVKFNAANCPIGSSISVTAKKGKKQEGFSPQTTVTAPTTVANVTITTTTQVPELSTITSIAAVAVAGGAFMVIRKRQNAQL